MMPKSFEGVPIRTALSDGAQSFKETGSQVAHCSVGRLLAKSVVILLFFCSRQLAAAGKQAWFMVQAKIRLPAHVKVCATGVNRQMHSTGSSDTTLQDGRYTLLCVLTS